MMKVPAAVVSFVLGWGVILGAPECKSIPAYHVRLGITSQAGILVTDVQAGSIAAKAGLATGDLILTTNGKGVRDLGTFEQFTSGIRERGLWDKALLEVVTTSGVNRGDRKMVLLVLPTPDTRFGYSSRPAFFVERLTPGGVGERIGLKAGDFVERIGQNDAFRFQSPVDLDFAVNTTISSGNVSMEVGRIVAAGTGGIQWTKRTIEVTNGGPLDGPVPPAGVVTTPSLIPK